MTRITRNNECIKSRGTRGSRGFSAGFPWVFRGATPSISTLFYKKNIFDCQRYTITDVLDFFSVRR